MMEHDSLSLSQNIRPGSPTCVALSSDLEDRGTKPYCAVLESQSLAHMFCFPARKTNPGRAEENRGNAREPALGASSGVINRRGGLSPWKAMHLTSIAKNGQLNCPGSRGTKPSLALVATGFNRPYESQKEPKFWL